MAHAYINLDTLRCTQDDADNLARHGLTSDPGSLLAIFDAIEQSVAAEICPEELHMLPPSVRICYH